MKSHRKKDRAERLVQHLSYNKLRGKYADWPRLPFDGYAISFDDNGRMLFDPTVTRQELGARVAEVRELVGGRELLLVWQAFNALDAAANEGRWRSGFWGDAAQRSAFFERVGWLREAAAENGVRGVLVDVEQYPACRGRGWWEAHPDVESWAQDYADALYPLQIGAMGPLGSYLHVPGCAPFLETAAQHRVARGKREGEKLAPSLGLYEEGYLGTVHHPDTWYAGMNGFVRQRHIEGRKRPLKRCLEPVIGKSQDYTGYDSGHRPAWSSVTAMLAEVERALDSDPWGVWFWSPGFWGVKKEQHAEFIAGLRDLRTRRKMRGLSGA